MPKGKEYKLGMKKVPISAGEIYRAGMASNDHKFVLDRRFDLLDFLSIGDPHKVIPKMEELDRRYKMLRYYSINKN